LIYLSNFCEHLNLANKLFCEKLKFIIRVATRFCIHAGNIIYFCVVVSVFISLFMFKILFGKVLQKEIKKIKKRERERDACSRPDGPIGRGPIIPTPAHALPPLPSLGPLPLPGPARAQPSSGPQHAFFFSLSVSLTIGARVAASCSSSPRRHRAELGRPPIPPGFFGIFLPYVHNRAL
jgi:hypothetical protein